MENEKEFDEEKVGQIFPLSSMLVLHDSKTNKIFLHLVSRNRYSHYDLSLGLITTIPVSEFSPYFMLYPEQVQEELTAEIISVIGRACWYGRKYRKAESNPFPKVFKRLARKLIRVYRHYTTGEFLTPVFVGKLYQMLRQIWVHCQAYFRAVKSAKRLRERLLRLRPIQAYGFEC